jgi:hypothetical protein
MNLYFRFLFCSLFLMMENSKALQCFRLNLFHNARLLLSFDDRTCCSSHAILSQYSGFYFASRSRNTFSRDVNFQYFRHLPITARRMEEVKPKIKSSSFAEIAGGVRRNIHKSASQITFEICVFVARLSLEFCDVVLRVGGLLLSIITALVQLILNFGKGFLFHRRLRISCDP